MSLKQLISPVVEVTSRIHADAGHVLVILRNGKVIDAFGPGRRYRGGFRLAPVGHLQAFQVSLSPVLLSLEVDDVPLKPSGDVTYHLPRVRLEVQARVSATREVLARVVRECGVEFAQTIDSAVTGEIRRSVKRYFAQLTHDDAWRGEHESRVLSTSHLFYGLFEVSAATIVEVTPDPTFRSRLNVDAEADLERHRLVTRQSVVQEETELEVLRAQGEVTVIAARMEALYDVSQRFDIPLPHLLDEELAKLEAAQRQEIVLKMLEDPTLFRRNPALESAVIEHLRHLSAGSNQLHTNTSRQLVELQYAPLRLTAGLATPQLRPYSDQLAAAWEAGGGNPGTLAGIGYARHDDQAGVIAVTRDRGELEIELPDLAAIVGCDIVRTTVIAHRPGLLEFVEGYLAARDSHLHAAAGQWSVSVEGSQLVIGVGDGSVRASELRKRLKAPDGLYIQPLTSVLPYDGVEVTVQGT